MKEKETERILSNTSISSKIFDYKDIFFNYNKEKEKKLFQNVVIDDYLFEEYYENENEEDIFNNKTLTLEQFKNYKVGKKNKNLWRIKHLDFDEDFILENINYVSYEVIARVMNTKEKIIKCFELLKNEDTSKIKLFEEIMENFDFDFYKFLSKKYNITFNLENNFDYLNKHSSSKDYKEVLDDYWESLHNKDIHYEDLFNCLSNIRYCNDIPNDILEEYYYPIIFENIFELKDIKEIDKDIILDESLNLKKNIIIDQSIEEKHFTIDNFDLDNTEMILNVAKYQDYDLEFIEIMDNLLDYSDEDYKDILYSNILKNPFILKKISNKEYISFLKNISKDSLKNNIIESRFFTVQSLFMTERGKKLDNKIINKKSNYENLNNNIGLY